jgi:AcrR family transcriptional regulator
VRRTLYGHFPSREALIDALATEAKERLEEAFTAARRPGAEPPAALAGLAQWSDPTGAAAATAALVTAGVAPAAARSYVQAALRTGR